MIATLLFVAFLGLMFIGVPIGAALGLAGAAAIALANADTQWFGLLAVPQNFYAGLGKYPLLAIPMFVLVGSIFDRSGVALRLVNFAVAIVGRGPGMLPLVAIAVAMFLGGISGSGPANAAAVGGVMIAAMSRAGYPKSFGQRGRSGRSDGHSDSAFGGFHHLLGAGARCFGAGPVRGRHDSRRAGGYRPHHSRRVDVAQAQDGRARSLHAPPAVLKSLREASWGLAAPVLILGGMRMGWFTPPRPPWLPCSTGCSSAW